MTIDACQHESGCGLLAVQVNPAGDLIYTVTSATPQDDSFKYQVTGEAAQVPQQILLPCKKATDCHAQYTEPVCARSNGLPRTINITCAR